MTDTPDTPPDLRKPAGPPPVPAPDAPGAGPPDLPQPVPTEEVRARETSSAPRLVSSTETVAPPPISEEAARRADTMEVEVRATGGRLFVLSAVTGLLTVLTLGLYRFWMKSRLRRFYWSAVRPGGLPLEYVGQPLEKLLGFLIAVVILAFYIGVVNLILMFASFSLLNSNFAAYAVSLLGVIPLWFYARYRARRYVLARTRWRGVRFGLEPGAWGYAWRAMVHWVVTIVSLGLLWPRMTFFLEKYKTDRTWFGNRRFAQGGKWTMLLPCFLHIPGAMAVTLVALFAALSGPLGLGPTGLPAAASVQALWLLVLSIPWLIYGIIHYQTRSLRLLTSHKTAGDLALRSGIKTGRVLRIYALGYFVISTLIVIPIVLLGVVIDALGLLDFDGTLNTGIVPRWALIVLGVALYFFIFLSWSTLKHTFVTLPWWRHAASTLTVTGVASLGDIHQRARDEAEQAEGFAEALDVGAAI